MKTTSKLLVPFIAIAFLFAACDENEALTPNPAFNPEATGENPMIPGKGSNNVNSTYYMNFEKDGSTYSLATCYVDTSGLPGIELQLVGQGDPLSQNAADRQSINFNVISDSTFFPEVDSIYQIGDSASLFQGSYFADFTSLEDSLIYVPYSGEIQFTAISDNGMEGTFSFDAANTSDDSLTISKGSFKARYLQ